MPDPSYFYKLPDKGEGKFFIYLLWPEDCNNQSNLRERKNITCKNTVLRCSSNSLFLKQL